MNRSVPHVAVWMLTYNHENYIGKALDSVLMQETSFPFLIYLGEDCSKDNTRQVCIEYANRHPDRIHLFLNESNNHRLNGETIYSLCFNSGAKYIAMLEGDDYWTDPKKLQSQYDLLEADPTIAMSLHNAHVVRDGEVQGLKTPVTSDHSYTLADALKRKVLGPTSSYFYRNPGGFPGWFGQVYGGDAAILVIMAAKGQLHYFGKVMSAYRLHGTSLERTYDRRPMDKALRDNQQYRTYMDSGAVTGKERIILFKKMSWNCFYRVLKGASMFEFRTILTDLFNSTRYLFAALRVYIQS